MCTSGKECHNNILSHEFLFSVLLGTTHSEDYLPVVVSGRSAVEILGVDPNPHDPAVMTAIHTWFQKCGYDGDDASSQKEIKIWKIETYHVPGHGVRARLSSE